MVNVMVVWVLSVGGGCGGKWVVGMAAWWRDDVGWVKMGDMLVTRWMMMRVLWWWDDGDDGDDGDE
nr:hypothetical protein [Tanacetum cinerariifolium]